MFSISFALSDRYKKGQSQNITYRFYQLSYQSKLNKSFILSPRVLTYSHDLQNLAVGKQRINTQAAKLTLSLAL